MLPTIDVLALHVKRRGIEAIAPVSSSIASLAELLHAA